MTLPELTFSKLLVAAVGLAAFVTLLLYVKRKRVSSAVLNVYICCCVIVASVAIVFDAFHRLMPNTHLARISIAVCVICGFVLCMTFDLIRKTNIKERYALLWMFPCLVLLVFTAWPRLLDFMRATFGMEYASSMVAVMFVSVIVVTFALSVTMSNSENKIAAVTRRCAMLEARIEKIEKELGEREKGE